MTTAVIATLSCLAILCCRFGDTNYSAVRVFNCNFCLPIAHLGTGVLACCCTGGRYGGSAKGQRRENEERVDSSHDRPTLSPDVSPARQPLPHRFSGLPLIWRLDFYYLGLSWDLFQSMKASVDYWSNGLVTARRGSLKAVLE
ncbi:hypothetical protein [Deinococcus peraridilitoris]|uniref:hypothetical protein n=1 Tax=Deinococcus peraridilitoris TaxID=432329 RepID=UPI00145DE247|nr:hypothetical protein [Deinococcus peraridilitoris]